MAFHCLRPVVKVIVVCQFFPDSDVLGRKNTNFFLTVNVPPFDNTVWVAGMIDEAGLVAKAAGVYVDIVLELHHVELPFGNVGVVSLFAFVGSQFENFSDVLDNELTCLNGFLATESQSPD